MASLALPSTVSRVEENTTLGSAFQIRANSSSLGSDRASPAVSQGSMSWYSPRPQRCAPSWRVCSLWNRISSSSGAAQSIAPSGPAMHPSSDTPIE